MYDPDSLMELIERPYYKDVDQPGDAYINLFNHGIDRFTKDYSSCRKNKEKFMEMISYFKGLKEARMQFLSRNDKI